MSPSTPPAFGLLTPRQTTVLLVAACLAWVVISFFSRGNLDSYNDMLENYAWSQPLLWGTHKHPPFFGWVVGIWFALFPQTDWAYRLLSYTNVAVGLLGVWALGRRLGLGRLAVWGALLLLWSFPYTTLAGKFNANSQLLSLWPWAAALLLASWQEKGVRGLWFSVWLGLVAAACMLSKYYSGVFLAGFLLPVFLHPDGRRWLATPRPYLALLVFALALAPHVTWMAAHDWAPIGYAMNQGGGAVVWRYVLRFTLAPLFYWLPAWLSVGLLYALAHARLTGQAPVRTAARFLLHSWLPQGRDDVLYWLALVPWALTLLFGMLGVVELSTPWAIPIGYAFALLWLRNLNSLSPQATDWVLARLRQAWWPVLALVLVLGAVVTTLNARHGDAQYYRPTAVAARAIVQAWEQRHPGQTLRWVGGDWAENAMLAFYAQPGLRTVPGLPDSFPAQLTGLGDWRAQPGLLLCPLGPETRQLSLALASPATHETDMSQPRGNEPFDELRTPPRTEVAVPLLGGSGPSTDSGRSGGVPVITACTEEAQVWLQAQGLSQTPELLSAERSGWLFPKPQAFVYAVFDVPAAVQRRE